MPRAETFVTDNQLITMVAAGHTEAEIGTFYGHDYRWAWRRFDRLCARLRVPHDMIALMVEAVRQGLRADDGVAAGNPGIKAVMDAAAALAGGHQSVGQLKLRTEAQLVLARLWAGLIELPPAPGPLGLSDREQRLLILSIEGKPRRQLLEPLGMSRGAFEGFLDNLCSRLGVRNLVQALTVTAQDELVEWPAGFERAVAASAPLDADMKTTLIEYIRGYEKAHLTRYPDQALADPEMGPVLRRLGVTTALAAVAVAARTGQIDDLEQLLERPPAPRLEDVTPRAVPVREPKPRVRRRRAATTARPRREPKQPPVPRDLSDRYARERRARREAFLASIAGLAVATDGPFILDADTEMMLNRRWREIVAATRTGELRPPAALAEHLAKIADMDVPASTLIFLQTAIDDNSGIPPNRRSGESHNRLLDLGVSYGLRTREEGFPAWTGVVLLFALWAEIIE
jgi:DNA-binding CsgD family transcriptional regulator